MAKQTIKTPICRVNWAFLDVPENAEEGSDEAKRRVTFFLPQEDPFVKELEAALLKDLREGVKDDEVELEHYNNPIKLADTQVTGKGRDRTTIAEKYPAMKGCAYFQATSKYPVTYGDKDGAVVNECPIYSGCYAIGLITTSYWSNRQSGNEGVGIYLRGIQLIEDGERLGGEKAVNAADLFEKRDFDAEANAAI